MTQGRSTPDEVRQRFLPRRSADGADEVSLGDLFHVHQLSLVRLATLLVDDQETAEDVVQDAFAGLHARHGQLLDPTRALAYLRAAVLNNARSALRRRRTARSFIAPHVRPTESAESLALLSAEHQQLLSALRRLPRRQREVLVLRYWADLSISEVADTLGISTGTVKSTAARGLSALSRILGVTT